MQLRTLQGRLVAEVPAEGPTLSSEQDALDLIGELYGLEAEWVLIPVARVDDEFFQLSNRRAGLFLQKFVNYGLRVAFVGDLAEQLAASKSLRDFVYESNRGGQLRFIRDASELGPTGR